ncbi:CE1 family esterase [Mariniluteicoccus flavus]
MLKNVGTTLLTASLLGAGLSVVPGPALATAAPARTPSSCADSQAPGTSEREHVVSGGRERSYIVHLPDAYAVNRDWPVVLVFHGRGNSAATTQAFSGLDRLPAIVVYADGVVGTGSGDRQAWEGAPYSASGVDDVAFTRDLLDDLAANHCVDERRVYATGKSNGAGFVGILACELADRIAAVAPVAAANYATGHPTCAPVRPVPLIAFHGSADATIPYAGDADRGLPAIPAWVKAWADRNRCHHRLATRELAPDATQDRWVGCAQGAETRLVTITGGGHTWPGEDAYSGGGYASQNIEATDLMWDFLAKHRLHR